MTKNKIWEEKLDHGEKSVLSWKEKSCKKK
jgi:hypothetical protein